MSGVILAAAVLIYMIGVIVPGKMRILCYYSQFFSSKAIAWNATSGSSHAAEIVLVRFYISCIFQKSCFMTHHSPGNIRSHIK